MAKGYGVETWCLTSLSPGRLVSGRLALIQALYRRVTTPRGTLLGGPEEASYGLDLAGWVGAVGDRIAVAAIPAMVRAEWLKDDRILDVQVTAAAVTGSDGLTSIHMTAYVTPVAESESFPMTLQVTGSAVTLLGGLP